MAERNERAYEKVIEHIKSEIWQGTLKRGERLPPERELAESLGVSRNSVREAIRTLSLLGFVSSTQGAGNFVTCDIEQNLRESLRMMVLLGETNYLQISQLRRGLESENARLAAERIKRETVLYINTYSKGYSQSAEQEFLQRIEDICANEVLEWENLRGEAQQTPQQAPPQLPEAPTSVQEDE